MGSQPSPPSHRQARLTFVTGKGGVGKTTVAAALALQAADRGRRVLAVDTLNRGDLAAAVSSHGGEQAVAGSLEVLGLTTQDSLNEYVRRYLKVPLAPANIGPLSRIFDFVANAAPAVKEILTVGKIGYEALHGDWDEVVVDAPASGHVVELLTAPTSLQDLIPSGPLVGQTAWLREVLASSSSEVMVVATPEELPVAESEALVARLVNETDVALGPLVVNRAPLPITAAGRAEADRLVGQTGGDERATTLALVSEAAVGRFRGAEPHVAALRSLAGAHGLALLMVTEHADNPVAAAMAELAERNPRP